MTVHNNFVGIFGHKKIVMTNIPQDGITITITSIEF